MTLNEKLQSYKIILASASPRRHELLHGMLINFELCKLNVDEKFPKNLVEAEVPEYLSRLKSAAFPETELSENTILITADTIVWKDEKVIEKPKDRDDAFNILSNLSGSRHEVFTGVTLRSKDRIKTFSAHSSVWFRNLSKEEILHYIDTCKPYDKAGAYGVQEWIGYVGIEKIEGSYFNVMGLPTQRLYLELEKFIEKA